MFCQIDLSSVRFCLAILSYTFPANFKAEDLLTFPVVHPGVLLSQISDASVDLGSDNAASRGLEIPLSLLGMEGAFQTDRHY